jgi:leucyl-tRNA synthetase
MDLRVSAKDLIPNHLTMALYNHAAVWNERPELWPRGYYCNGHILVDAEKMSKSLGNFLMMYDCCRGGGEKAWSSDATRFALADAGDFLDDANFAVHTANSAVLLLFNELEWVEATVRDTAGKAALAETWQGRAFDNEMSWLVQVTLLTSQPRTRNMFNVATPYTRSSAARYARSVLIGDSPKLLDDDVPRRAADRLVPLPDRARRVPRLGAQNRLSYVPRAAAHLHLVPGSADCADLPALGRACVELAWE